MAAQQASKFLPQSQAMALKAEITETLLEAKPAKMNLTESETRALKNLKKDDTIIITPADKGKSLVVMDKDVYVQRMEEKLSDETTYKKIPTDPTQDIKEEIIVKLKSLLGSKIIDDKLYEDLYPDVTQIPRAYGSPKIHKEGYPLREIVDSTNSAGKKIDKYVSRIIKTYTLDNPHNIKNSRDFVDKIKPLIVDENR